MIEFLNVIFRAITGMKATPETLFVLGFFVLLGWLFGFLTRRIGVLKILLLAIFGSVALIAMAIASNTVIVCFLLGVLLHHGWIVSQVLWWAEDASDLLFALQHRRAFVEIREHERRERSRAQDDRRAAFRKHHAGSSGDRRKQRTGSSSRATGRNLTEAKSRAGSFEREEAFRRLGLDPRKRYSAKEVRKVFRALARQNHPDAGGDPVAFIALVEAYEWAINCAET